LVSIGVLNAPLWRLFGHLFLRLSLVALKESGSESIWLSIFSLKVMLQAQPIPMIRLHFSQYSGFGITSYRLNPVRQIRIVGRRKRLLLQLGSQHLSN
jgi:hypothetical protein